MSTRKDSDDRGKLSNPRDPYPAQRPVEMPEQNPGQRKERVGEVMGDNTGGQEKAPEDPKSDQAPASRPEIKVKPGE